MRNKYAKLTNVPTFVLILPIINITAYLTADFFPRHSINPGNIRAFVIIVFLIHFSFTKYPKNRACLSIIIFIIYIFTISFFSSNYYNTYYRTFQIFISSILFAVGFRYFKTEDHLRSLSKVYLVVYCLLILNLFVSNIFDLGGFDYRYYGDNIKFGIQGVNVTKLLSGFFLMSPLFYFFSDSKSMKKIIIVVNIVAVIFIILSVKRGALLSLVVGFSFYFLFSKQKKMIFRHIFVMALIMAVCSSLYLDNVVMRFHSRLKRMPLLEQFELQKEARYNEYLMVLKDFENRNLLNKLFGIEFLNEMEHYNVRRMFHTDYMSMLSGGGIIGLFLYLYVYFAIWKEQRRYIHLTTNKKLANELFSVSQSLIIACLILAISGLYHSIDLRGFIFMYLGAVTSLLRNLHLKQIRVLQ